jgi:hypothetical protein
MPETEFLQLEDGYLVRSEWNHQATSDHDIILEVKVMSIPLDTVFHGKGTSVLRRRKTLNAKCYPQSYAGDNQERNKNTRP